MKLDDSNRQPFFTIIIATLNVENTIEECLESIIHQTAIDMIEILVKDGASTDHTIDILKKYNSYISHWESSPDSGIYDAWNKVLPEVTGKWVLFLGADDFLFNETVISRSFSVLQTIENNIDLAYGMVRLISRGNEVILDSGLNWNKTKKCINEKMCIPHQGIFHSSSLFEKYGNFSTRYDISSDYEFLRRVLKNDNILYLDFLLSCMRVGGISSNQKYTFKRLSEIRQINKMYGSSLPGLRWLVTYGNACFRYLLMLLIGEKKAKVVLDKFRTIAGLPQLWTKL